MAKATGLIWPRTVTGDGEGLVLHAGLVWLGEVADRSGLTVWFSHDPGVTLVPVDLSRCRRARFDRNSTERGVDLSLSLGYALEQRLREGGVDGYS